MPVLRTGFEGTAVTTGLKGMTSIMAMALVLLTAGPLTEVSVDSYGRRDAERASTCSYYVTFHWYGSYLYGANGSKFMLVAID